MSTSAVRAFVRESDRLEAAYERLELVARDLTAEQLNAAEQLLSSGTYDSRTVEFRVEGTTLLVAAVRRRDREAKEFFVLPGGLMAEDL